MSLIQIDKKAVTQAEARALLDASCALTDPFGIPTIVYRGEDFTLGKNVRREEEAKVLKSFQPLARTNSWLNIFSSVVADNVLANLHYLQTAALVYNALCNPCRAKDSSEDTADHYDPDSFTPPAANYVTLPSIETTMQARFFSIDYRIDVHDLPGTPEQWQFKTLWHEFAHGAGACEPQSDAIAAVMTRKAFENVDVIRANADHRAFRNIFHYFVHAERETYGWGMCEANDYVASLPEATIDAMTKAQVRDIRFQRFNPLGDRIYKLGEMLRSANIARFRINDAGHFATVAGEMAAKDGLDEVERRILRRFQLACVRISLGEVAYEEGNDLVDPELLAVERQPPMTFTPGEYIPDC
ncbi:MAG: hypothetical protein GC137_02595 [Alphaproteobacteria bacterium]|nr:hypothetical protein [Alphaproteobacteria bacterium]